MRRGKREGGYGKEEKEVEERWKTRNGEGR